MFPSIKWNRKATKNVSNDQPSSSNLKTVSSTAGSSALKLETPEATLPSVEEFDAQTNLIETFEANYIFWYNHCLQHLFKEQGDICPPITKKQISTDITKQLSSLINALCNGEFGESELRLFARPSIASENESSNLTRLSRFNERVFTPLLHFNIRFTRFLSLKKLSVAFNPLDPHVCFNLLSETLSKTNLPVESQGTLLNAFIEIINEELFNLIQESNLLLTRPHSPYQQSEKPETGSASENSDEVVGLQDHQESVAANGANLTEEALRASVEAIEDVLGTTPIPIKVFPLIKEWERLLFKLYLTKGSDSNEWSKALRTLVAIRRIVQTNHKQTEDKQSHLDSLTYVLGECRKSLASNLLSAEKIDSILQPFEEVSVMLLYVQLKAEEVQQYKP